MAGVQTERADVRRYPPQRGHVARPPRAELLGKVLVGLPEGEGERGRGAGTMCDPRSFGGDGFRYHGAFGSGGVPGVGDQ